MVFFQKVRKTGPLFSRKAFHAAMTGAALLGFAGLAWACADVTSYPVWRLAAPEYDEVGRPAIAPGNDTRINLLWLMRSLHPVGDTGAAYPEPDWATEQLGHSFLTWSSMRAALWPHPQPTDDTSARGDPACAAPGQAEFAAALAANAAVPVSERSTLLALRAKVGCGPVDWAVTVNSAQGREYLAYLKAAAAFHAADWQAARDGFATLTRARDPWVAETSAYMPIRIALQHAVAGATDQYGNFDGGKVDVAAAVEAGRAIAAYLKAWPHGRYTASAQGLTRRVLWLRGDMAELAHSYEHLAATTPPDSEAAADLAEEIDGKLLAESKADDVIRRAGDMPLLLAVTDMRQMRKARSYSETAPSTDPAGPAKLPLSANELAAQKAVFGGRPDLFAFLQATHAYYSGEPSASILAAIPADTHTPGATPLAFSRQVLRGMALADSRDAGEAGFWAGLIGAGRPLYQRPFAELGLAVHWQRQDRLDLIFAPGSPIEDQMTREILLQTIAPPSILRAEAANTGRPEHERDIARFILLYKSLSRGAYADFVRDVALVPTGAPPGTLYDFAGENPVAVGLFAHGKWSDGFACPPLAQTAATLARSPLDRPARLCLGDFWRLNGFDTFAPLSTARMVWGISVGPETLGNAPDRFPGAPLRRDAIYAAILADPQATPDERAYALYRSVMCYAPGGYNECAGVFLSADAMNKASVAKSQRQAWFLELKRRYPDSPWAKTLRYYW